MKKLTSILTVLFITSALSFTTTTADASPGKHEPEAMHQMKA